MKITQLNLNNTTGFYQKEDTPFGVDEKGNLAPGFQYHDALVWEGSPGTKFLEEDIRHVPLSQFMAHWHDMFTRIAEYLVATVQPKYVLDIGCGSGQLSNYIRKVNKDIVTVTVDGNRDVLKSPYIDHNHFVARTDEELDFRDENGNKMLFDLIISLEHFEHISDNKVDVLMDNIVNHSKKGTHLIFTASTTPYPHDSHSHIHCNSRDRGYWLDIIRNRGFENYNVDYHLDRAGHTSEIFSVKS